MIINLNMNSDVPIYVQLRNEIVMGIGRGELKRGESLPTVRQMAADIGVNTMTVNKAYKILKDEGYIEIDRRHGAKVNPSINLSFEFKEKLESELELLVAESVLKGISKEEFLNMFNSVFAGIKGIVNN
ncbi:MULTISPECIES: GntR family transcriptional regulator [Clostridium]|uniref:GntR family transcriptional regulator n=1 Tax=Clostridium paraputrificum TaxID=29363 RepID=A0A1B8RPX8_9CLOT|nr:MULTISPECIES: GntR family transcriptional regulator [Clostridium]MDB2102094.1 GntR family transcriptional regulator [Clostridium paraputrificum]MDC0803456.1 GntR family transcriptional regulator [Clostridium paraputrificum]MDU6520727.1 GntR family transcriptional regulator [Clostridium sp.]OBY10873.1 GntR family transcriptional regulator [Clostridium paraputrificum]